MFSLHCVDNSQEILISDTNLLCLDAELFSVLDIVKPYVRSHSQPKECTHHQNSELIEFSRAGRKIQKGCCLRHSQKGCITFSGIDINTGQLLYISEWMIKYSQLRSKCVANCKLKSTAVPCTIHGVDEVIADIENQMMELAQIRHNNLVRYECVQCIQKPEGILVYLVQDFVLGNSVCNLSSSLGWCEQNASMIAKSVLDALLFLSNKGVMHGLLYDTAVYIDNCSMVRVTDFGLVSYLQDLIEVQKIMKNDLEALGMLVESLSPTPSSLMREFIEKCKSPDTILSDLIEDPFLLQELGNDEHNLNDEYKVTNTEVRVPMFTENSLITSKSRFKSDYSNLEYLGKGGFGEVYKGRYNLDNKEYAIKRIRLPEKSRKLYDAMTREVKVLSRLNHENVVRYYTSWIDTIPFSERGETPKFHSDVSDSVEFVNSSNDDEEDIDAGESESEDPMLKYMYIQMEYCNGSTLRTIIDDNLYADPDRFWRLFREIVEGLAHIHQQGMIHRDLKPANIFIGSQDRIKIGDFGLATTCQILPENQEHSRLKSSLNVYNSLSCNVGTELYSAPELFANNSNYDQKVDLYSLGIILFEMSCAPFNTVMERVFVLNELRTAPIKMLVNFFSDPIYIANREVIQWLVNHNPDNRPTTKEILTSEKVPRVKLETHEFHEMVCDTIARPQSKQYEYLVTRCLEQESDAFQDLTYNHVPEQQHTIDHVKSKILNLFRRHGAIEVVTPLLTPCSKNYVIDSNAVRLMTHTGNNVFLPYDLRLPFARHIAVNGINSMRRYCFDRVYRKERIFNFHPKQLYECSFDIVTPNPGNFLVDAELMLIAYDITKEFPALREKSIFIRINHTTLLRAILLYQSVPKEKHDDVAFNLLDYTNGKITKSKIKQILIEASRSPRKGGVLFKMLLTEYSVIGENNTINSSLLLNLLKGRGAASSLANAAMRDIETVVKLVQGLGVNCAINLLPGVPVGYERTKSGGIVWQMLVEEKFGRQNRRYILAAGERYDTFLSEFQKSAHNEGIALPAVEISAAGFTFSLENLMHAFTTSTKTRNGNLDWTPVQVLVCILGVRPSLVDVIELLKSLWAAGICSAFVEAATSENARHMARKLGARHLVILNEIGGITLRTFITPNVLLDRHITTAELINTIQRELGPDEQNLQAINNNLKRKINTLKREKSQLRKNSKKMWAAGRSRSHGSKINGVV